jgi:ubiquinone/menaquinone biosynthesis C-methylase UbiE
MAGPSSAAEVIAATVPPGPGKRVLDVGCGGGDFARALAAMGYQVAGADPQADKVSLAKTKVPTGSFAVAGAEALPFEPGSFDAVTMVHSLHHVPGPLMERALKEALRCLKTAAPIIVVEPLAEGPFFAVLRLVDDETTVRAAAQAALEEACRKGLLRRVATHRWERREVFGDAATVIDRMVAADPARRPLAEAKAAEIAAMMRQVGDATPGGLALVNLSRADIFVAG